MLASEDRYVKPNMLAVRAFDTLAFSYMLHYAAAYDVAASELLFLRLIIRHKAVAVHVA